MRARRLYRGEAETEQPDPGLSFVRPTAPKTKFVFLFLSVSSMLRIRCCRARDDFTSDFGEKLILINKSKSISPQSTTREASSPKDEEKETNDGTNERTNEQTDATVAGDA